LMKHFRWEIPYQYIVRWEEAPEVTVAAGNTGAPAAEAASREKPPPGGEAPNSSTAVANTSGASPSVVPLQNRPKTA
jgi:hypothetical protein